jgi:ATP-dependent RNA helicase RhlE
MLEHYFNNNAVGRALVFTRTKHGADRVARQLSRAGIVAEAIHGNKSQNARTRAISKFKSSAPPVLVATDIAARGLDIDEISHVINYDLPNTPETYVHRIGRTGRAGASGLAVSFCDSEERPLLKDIERLIRKPIPIGPDRPKLPEPQRRPAVRSSRPRQEACSSHPARRDGDRPVRRESELAMAACLATGGDLSSVSDGTRTDDSRNAGIGVGYRSRGRSTPRRGVRRGR